MPSRYQGAGSGDERQRFPDIEARIGYDPARYLDVPLLSTTSGEDSPILTAVSMIRGISRLGVANAWIQAERRLGRGGGEDEDAPRDQIMALLESKVDDLVEHGQRPSELPASDPPRYQEHDREVPPKECYLIRRELGEDGLEVVERESIETARESTARAKLQDKRNTTK